MPDYKKSFKKLFGPKSQAVDSNNSHGPEDEALSTSPTPSSSSLLSSAPSYSSLSSFSTLTQSSSSLASSSASFPASLSATMPQPMTQSITEKQPALSLNDLLQRLPSLSGPLTPSVFQSLFVRKLYLCSLPFDYCSAYSLTHTRIRNAKTVELNDILSSLSTHSTPQTNLLPHLFNFFNNNLFRELPTQKDVGPEIATPEGGTEGEGEGGVEDPSWTHLQLVYEALLRFLVCTDIEMKILRKYVNTTFVRRIINLFDSQDHREREFLKTLLHRIYVKFFSLRPFIRKCMNDVFFVFIYETERHNGISELLEIYGSLIVGFSLPLHTEHISFLARVLIPLHKARTLAPYHAQLCYAVMQFIAKEPALSDIVLRGLVKYWPMTASSAKTVLFVNELEEVLEVTPDEIFKEVCVPLFIKIRHVMVSQHFQVSERVLFLWHNETIARFIESHREVLLPIIYPALLHNKRHWNAIVTTLSVNILKLFEEIDFPLLDSIASQYHDPDSSSSPSSSSSSSSSSGVDVVYGVDEVNVASIDDAAWDALVKRYECHESSHVSNASVDKNATTTMTSTTTSAAASTLMPPENTIPEDDDDDIPPPPPPEND